MDEKNIERDSESIEENEESTSTVVQLPLGVELSAEETYEISASEKTHFFVIIGSTGSGKTTLVTSIYHLFLSGKYKTKYLFAGSKTLAAFEKRAFYLRTTSQNNQVLMRRTPVGTADILHIRIKVNETDQFTNLLFSDFSGEDFGNISGNVDAAKEDFGIINSANHLIILLDGEKIASKKQRLAEVQQMIQVLRTFWDGNLIRESSNIIIAVSKYDLLIDMTGSLKDSFPETIMRRIVEQLPELEDRLVFQFVASMPTDTKILNAGYGTSELLDILLNPPKHQIIASQVTHSFESQFNLWKGRMV